MTIFEYAIYRCAANLMTVAERIHALDLAKRADAGDRMASLSLRELTMDVIADSENRGNHRFKKVQKSHTLREQSKCLI